MSHSDAVMDALLDVLKVIQFPEHEAEFRKQLEVCDGTLKALPSAPPAQVEETADWFQRKFFLTFERTSISPFFHQLETSPEAALKKLYDRAMTHLGLLKRCGEILRCPEELPSHFLVSLRCALLQPDVLLYGDCGDEYHHRDVLLRWLMQHGRTCLQNIEDGQKFAQRDSVIVALHALTLTQTREFRLMWRHLIAKIIREKAQCVSEDLTTTHVADLLAWKEKVLDPFCRVVLSRNDKEFRTEVDDWCQQTEVELLDVCGTRLIKSFFNLVVEYPESTPALQDLRLCLHRNPSDRSLHELLVATAKKTLATRLHHAGARTEDILTVLVATIRCMCSLYRKNEQGPVVLDIIGATLRCLERRKDSVAALVQEITTRANEGDTFGGEEANSSDDEGAGGSRDGGTASQQTNVIKVLLSTMSLNEIVKEYKATLADLILGRTDYDCTPETEVLERMKCFFGEETLTSCDVMLRDVQQSRRIMQWIKDQGKQPTQAPATTMVISYTCWPEMDDGGQEMLFEVHPSLSGMLEQLQEGYQKMKPQQKLQWLNHLGVIKMSLTQESVKEGRVSKSFDLTPFQASVLLHLKDASPGATVSYEDLAEKMKVPKEGTIKPRLQAFIPSLFLHTDDGVSVQQKELGSHTYIFEEESSTDEAPSGMTSKELEMFTNMVAAMVKTGGKKTVSQIENSMRMFGKYSGSTQDVQAFLQYLVNQKKISTDGTTYTKAA